MPSSRRSRGATSLAAVSAGGAVTRGLRWWGIGADLISTEYRVLRAGCAPTRYLLSEGWASGIPAYDGSGRVRAPRYDLSCWLLRPSFQPKACGFNGTPRALTSAGGKTSQLGHNPVDSLLRSPMAGPRLASSPRALVIVSERNVLDLGRSSDRSRPNYAELNAGCSVVGRHANRARVMPEPATDDLSERQAAMAGHDPVRS